MWILTSFEDMCLDPPDFESLKKDGPTEELMAEILSAVKSSYIDAATNAKSYLCEEVSAENFLFGALEPEKLIKTLRSWVPSICKAFVTCLNKVYTFGMDPEKICVDTIATYCLQTAARQLDNSWFSNSTYGCYLANSQGYPYFRVFPSEDQLACIAANPNEYFIIEVFVKS